MMGGGDNTVRDLKRTAPISTEGLQDILYFEVEEAICLLKNNKIPGLTGSQRKCYRREENS